VADGDPLIIEIPRIDSDLDAEDPPMTEADLEASRKLILDLDLTSCDFVGDSGCVDPNCWRCHSPLSPSNLRTLAENLATAGKLSRAWQLRDVDPAWFPGCNLGKTPANTLVRVTYPRHVEGAIFCLDHMRQLSVPRLTVTQFSAEAVTFWGHRCLMCGVDAVPGRHCENDRCKRALHPQWPAVYCSNDCALEDA